MDMAIDQQTAENKIEQTLEYEKDPRFV